MKNKILYFAFLTAFFVIFFHNTDAFATTYDNIQNFTNIAIRQYNGSYYIVYSNNAMSSGPDNGFYVLFTNNSGQVGSFGSLQDALNALSQNPSVSVPDDNANSNYRMYELVICKGNVSGTVPPNTVFPPEPETHWYDDFVDWWDDELQAFEYDVIDPVLNIWDWIKSLFVDDPEYTPPDISDIIVSPSPTPTPIPYEVQIRTDPVTNNTSIVYVYNDTNNNTVVSNEPPAPYNPLPVTIGTGLGTGNGSDSGPQYYTNTDPVGLPDLDWLNFDLDFDGNIISTITGFGSGIETINVASNEYSSGIESIFSIFLQIPQDIYFVIGIALSVILIAGIISRFLS